MIQQPGVFAEVTAAANSPSGGTVTEVHFRVVYPETGVLQPGSAQVYTVWDPVANFGKQGCFVRYSSVAPGSVTPGQGVASDGRVLVRFSEPMDPTTVSAFDNLPILRVDPGISTPSARDYVIGAVSASSDLKEYAFAPVINFKHTQGSATDRFWVNVGSGAQGPTDLSGRALTAALPAVSFTIDPNDPTETNGGLVFRFSSQDELNDDGKPEWRGQTAPDLTTGTVNPRPVTRLRATCDRTTLVPGAMTPFPRACRRRSPAWAASCRRSGATATSDTEWRTRASSTSTSSTSTGRRPAATWSATRSTSSRSDSRTRRSCRTRRSIRYGSAGLSRIRPGRCVRRQPAQATNDPQVVVHDKSLGYVVDPSTRKPSATVRPRSCPTR